MSVCPSVCPSVCSNTIYSLIFCPIQSKRIFLETVCQGKGFKITSSYNNQEIDRKSFWKTYLYYENRSGSVHLFVCPFVCNATTFSILDRMGQQRYLWNPHAKGQVLRHFWSNSVEKWKSLPFCPNHLSILWKQVSVCPSVCLSVCAYAIYSFIVALIWTTRVPMEPFQ